MACDHQSSNQMLEELRCYMICDIPNTVVPISADTDKIVHAVGLGVGNTNTE